MGMSKMQVQKLEARQLRAQRELESKLKKEKKFWQKQAQKDAQSQMEAEQKLEFSQQRLNEKVEERELTANKLSQITKKLMHGSRLMNLAKKQEKELKSKKMELEEQIEKQNEMRLKVEQQEKEHLLLQQKYQTHESELEDKSQKLTKLFDKYKLLTHKLSQVESEFEFKREQYLESIQLLNQRIMFHDAIIEFSINPQQLERLSQRIQWHQQKEQWSIHKLDAGNLINLPKPESVRLGHAPICEWNRIQCVLLANQNPRYRNSNLIQLQLDMPQRTTQDFVFNT
jgi:kinesin family protein 3/17